MDKQGRRADVEVLLLLQVLQTANVAAAVSAAIVRGAVGFDAVEQLHPRRIERRAPRA